MTRKKVKLVWIVNDAARKASLKKRRVGLLKKVSELTTLCGVNAFAIIYSPDEPEPMVWPSPPEVEQLIMRYESIPEVERCKKMTNQESYLKERMAKSQEHCRKNHMKNREYELVYLMDRLRRDNEMDSFEVTELQAFIWLLEEKMRELRKRSEYFQQVPPLPSYPFPPPPPLPLPMSPHGDVIMEEMGQEGGGGGSGGELMRFNPQEALMWDQWFIDMMNNNENIAGGGSGTNLPQGLNFPGFPGGGGGFDMGVYPGRFGDSSAGNIVGMGLPQGNMNIGMNPFELGMPPYVNPFGLGLHPPPQNFAGSNSTNVFGLGLPPPPPPPENFAGSSSANIFGLGPPPPHPENFAGSSSANVFGLGLPPRPPAPAPDSTTGESPTAAGGDLGLPGFLPAGTDTGMPFDPTKPWPHNF
uniref:MADS-box domain-containing protein n=1 Tax=Manihot esculenta TaxID=3983 RepID=A0A2C9V9H6_MANES